MQLPLSVERVRIDHNTVFDEPLRQWIGNQPPDLRAQIEVWLTRTNATRQPIAEAVITPATEPTTEPSTPALTQPAADASSRARPLATARAVTAVLSGDNSSADRGDESPLPTTSSSTAPALRKQHGMVRPLEGGEGFEIVTIASPFETQLGAAITRTAGVVVDEQGHVLLPIYIARESIGDIAIAVTDDRGRSAQATFVGSDHPTGLSVFALKVPPAQLHLQAVKTSNESPREGSLMMMLSPEAGAARLAVWTGGHQQEQGIAIDLDGAVAGFQRGRQFLSMATAKPIVDQIVRFGEVRRAQLGVIVTQEEAQSGRRIVRIDQVAPGSAADLGGLLPGDFILSIAGSPVEDVPTFAAAIATRRGATALQIFRNGTPMSVNVELK